MSAAGDLRENPAPTSRRDRERLRHRREILDAARRVLLERGVHGVTIEHVAKQAEFAVGSIYRHFASKEELLHEVLLTMADAFVGELDELMSVESGFEERFEAIVRLMYDRQVDSRPLVAALFELPGPMPSEETETGRRFREVPRRLHAILDRLLAQGQVEGVIRSGPRRPLVVGLSGLVNAFARGGLFTGGPGVDGDVPGEIIGLFLHGARSS